MRKREKVKDKREKEKNSGKIEENEEKRKKEIIYEQKTRKIKTKKQK